MLELLLIRAAAYDDVFKCFNLIDNALRSCISMSIYLQDKDSLFLQALY